MGSFRFGVDKDGRIVTPIERVTKMPKQVTVWQTPDGNTFESEDDARKHETLYKIRTGVSDLFNNSESTADLSDLEDFIVEHAKELRKLLNDNLRDTLD